MRMVTTTTPMTIRMTGSIRPAAVSGGHVLLEELGDGVEHLRQRAGGFADLDHLDGQLGKDLGLGRGLGQALALAHRVHAGKTAF